MELFIQIRNGQPFEHPIFGDNFREAFPNVDTDNLPPEFAKFVRVPKPELDVYQVFEAQEPVYRKVDGVWKDVWLVRAMTPEEKTVAQQNFKDSWARRRQAGNWSAWVFNETTCKFDSPIPRPAVDKAKKDAGIYTWWCGAENNWKDTPIYPNDGKKYMLDFFAWEWIPFVADATN